MYFLFLLVSLHTARWRPAIIDFGIFLAKTDQSCFEPEAEFKQATRWGQSRGRVCFEHLFHFPAVGCQEATKVFLVGK